MFSFAQRQRSSRRSKKYKTSAEVVTFDVKYECNNSTGLQEIVDSLEEEINQTVRGLASELSIQSDDLIRVGIV